MLGCSANLYPPRPMMKLQLVVYSAMLADAPILSIGAQYKLGSHSVQHCRRWPGIVPALVTGSVVHSLPPRTVINDAAAVAAAVLCVRLASAPGHYQMNLGRRSNAGQMLRRRLRRWPSIWPALCVGVVVFWERRGRGSAGRDPAWG